jgi:hypothetical protein
MCDGRTSVCALALHASDPIVHRGSIRTLRFVVRTFSAVVATSDITIPRFFTPPGIRFSTYAKYLVFCLQTTGWRLRADEGNWNSKARIESTQHLPLSPSFCRSTIQKHKNMRNPFLEMRLMQVRFRNCPVRVLFRAVVGRTAVCFISFQTPPPDQLQFQASHITL